MIVSVEDSTLEIPEGMDLLEWCRDYFRTSNMRGLAGYYDRLEKRYAKMGMGITALSYRQLKKESINEDELAAFHMALKLAPYVMGYHMRLYRRYAMMGLYHESNRHRELARETAKYDMYLAYKPFLVGDISLSSV